MFARFFIERPVLANVIACVTMLLGAVALFYLPNVQQQGGMTKKRSTDIQFGDSNF